MQQTKNQPFNGVLTYICEGNANPYSKFFSRKLHLSPQDAILLGRGYNITTSPGRQIIDDLTGIGISYKKAEIFSKGSGLRGPDAQRFVKNYKNEVTLSPEQENRLFEIDYTRLNNQLIKLLATSEKRYGLIQESEIQQYQWEILMDFLVTGDLQSKTQDMLLVTLKKAIDRENSNIFDLLIMDVEYWKKTGIHEDRAKMRSIFAKEWERIIRMFESSRLASSEEALAELLYQSPNIFTIQGFFVDYDLDNLNMLLKRHSPHPHIKKDPKDDGATFGDLVLCLKIFYDNPVLTQTIGGCLTPSGIMMGDGEGVYREFYPDNEQSNKVIESTRFGEVISEASLIIAQIASGSVLKRKGDRLERGLELFDYPEELKHIGLLPIETLKSKKGLWMSDFGSNKTKSQLKEIAQAAKIGIVVWAKSHNMSMIKLWLVAKDYDDIQTQNSNGEFFIVKDVKLGVQANKLVITSKGELKEMPIEEPDDPAAHFAKTFTENLEIISKYYPVFKRIKQIYKAMLLAHWLYTKRIPVDMMLIKEFYQRELLNMVSPQQRVANGSDKDLLKNSLKGSASQSPLASPFNHGPSTPGRFSPPSSNRNMYNFPSYRSEPNQMNFRMAQTSANSPMRMTGGRFASPDFRIPKDEILPPVGNHKLYIYAGVLLDFKHRKKSLSKIMERVEKSENKDLLPAMTSTKKPKNEENINNKIPRIDLNYDLDNVNVCSIVFPFLKSTCAVCQTYLKHSEVTKPHQGIFYCRLHHPLSCNYCFNICRDNYVTIEDGKYHSHCLKCRHCGGPLKDKLIKTKEGFIHSNCMGDYLRELCETNKLNELFVADDDNLKGMGSLKHGIMKKKPFNADIYTKNKRNNDIHAEKRVHLMSQSTRAMETVDSPESPIRTSALFSKERE